MNTLPALFHVCRAAAVAAAIGSALPAMAASLKPGLWEMTSKVAAADPQAMQAMAAAQQQMAALPADQRRAIEQTMAQHGVRMELADGGGVKVKFCLTPEQAANPALPSGQPGKCSSTNTPVPGGMNVAFRCDKPRSSGKGQVIFDGDAGYSMRMDVDSTVQGQGQHMTVESSGRWLAADCAGTPPVH